VQHNGGIYIATMKPPAYTERSHSTVEQIDDVQPRRVQSVARVPLRLRQQAQLGLPSIRRRNIDRRCAAAHGTRQGTSNRSVSILIVMSMNASSAVTQRLNATPQPQRRVNRAAI
jgi:hypothetical protein